MCRSSPQKKLVMFLSFMLVLCKLAFLMALFSYVYPLIPMMKHACRMALASNIQKYTFKMVLGPCKQCFIIFSEGLKLSIRSDI